MSFPRHPHSPLIIIAGLGRESPNSPILHKPPSLNSIYISFTFHANYKRVLFLLPFSFSSFSTKRAFTFSKLHHHFHHHLLLLDHPQVYHLHLHGELFLSSQLVAPRGTVCKIPFWSSELDLHLQPLSITL